MSKELIIKFISKEEEEDARLIQKNRADYRNFKERFKPTVRPTVFDDYSDYVHISMISLHESSQDAMISLMRDIKKIGDAATKYLDFAYGEINSRVFFCYPVEPFDLLGAISSYQLVKYETKSEADAHSDALYWPGGGNLVVEYRNTISGHKGYAISGNWDYPEAWVEISDQITKHMAKWSLEPSKEDVSTKHDPSDGYRWMIAVQKKNIEFMSKLNHIKAALPEIEIAIREWARSVADQIIEQEQYEEAQSTKFNGDADSIDMSVFDPD